MIEQAQRNDRVEEFLKTSGLIEYVCDSINKSLHEARAEEQLPPRLPPDTSISYYNRLLSGHEQARDALDRPFDLSFAGWEDNVLLLIDPDPRANWSHLCWVAAAELSGRRQPEIVRATYPPLETSELRLVRYKLAAHILAA